MYKIGIIVPSLKAGGLERVATIIANESSDLYKIFIITLDAQSPFYELKNSVELIQSPLSISKLWKHFRILTHSIWLRNVIKEANLSVVCSFGEKYNSFVLLSLFGLNIPIFVANRASPLSSIKGFRGFVNPKVYRLAAGVLLQTEKSRSILQERYKFKKVQVIGNPINLNYPKNKQELTIINVGSIGGNKNQNWLINYFHELDLVIGESWSLHFIGDGPKKEYCENLAIEKGIDEKVRFHGRIKNVEEHYSRASIFAFTSTSEGFPNALAEAMAAGCACIAYDCIAGPSDIIDDGVNGFLIPEGNHDLYKVKLLKLMEDETLRARFGHSAIEKMKHFSAEKITQQFLDFIIENK